MTDSLRAQILKLLGYRVDIVEFIEGEHTPQWGDWRTRDMDTVVHELAVWLFCTGTTFLKYYWDSTQGKYLGKSSNGLPIYEGDIKVDVVPPFEVVVDPTCTRMEDAQWAIQAKRVSINYVKGRFSKLAKYIGHDSGKASGEFYTDRLKAASPLNYASLTTDSQDNDESTILKEYWEKPCPEHPHGLHAILCGGVLLFEEDMVKQEGDLADIPLVKFDETIMPGRFWCVSTTEQVIPLQKEYNKSISQIVEA
jgi:hypothetical protein